MNDAFCSVTAPMGNDAGTLEVLVPRSCGKLVEPSCRRRKVRRRRSASNDVMPMRPVHTERGKAMSRRAASRKGCCESAVVETTRPSTCTRRLAEVVLRELGAVLECLRLRGATRPTPPRDPSTHGRWTASARTVTIKAAATIARATRRAIRRSLALTAILIRVYLRSGEISGSSRPWEYNEIS